MRLRTVERPRDRVLSDAEVTHFWHALDDAPMGKDVAAVLRLALITGQRVGELSGMGKQELALALAGEGPMWTHARHWASSTFGFTTCAAPWRPAWPHRLGTPPALPVRL